MAALPSWYALLMFGALTGASSVGAEEVVTGEGQMVKETRLKYPRLHDRIVFGERMDSRDFLREPRYAEDVVEVGRLVLRSVETLLLVNIPVVVDEDVLSTVHLHEKLVL